MDFLVSSALFPLPKRITLRGTAILWSEATSWEAEASPIPESVETSAHTGRGAFKLPFGRLKPPLHKNGSTREEPGQADRETAVSLSRGGDRLYTGWRPSLPRQREKEQRVKNLKETWRSLKPATTKIASLTITGFTGYL